ncbi:MAG: glycoside hydrolase family 43 protein [Clostridia bacterium]
MEIKTDAYLFVHFIDKRHNTPMSEQVYFSVSRDGYSWETLNGGEPILISNVGECGVRDPFIIRSAENDKFYIIGTDLNVHLRDDGWKMATINGSRNILVWESTDLVNWTDVRMCKVAPDDAGCTWAPEVIYDEENKDYMVFWASRSLKDGRRKCRMYYSKTTDFRSFTTPQLYIEKDSDVIDTTIVKCGDKYYRFSKDETVKVITVEEGDSLLGSFRKIESTMDKIKGVEGPECYQLKDGKWCLIVDRYAKNQGYCAYLSDDLSTGRFVRSRRDFNTDVKFRHGGVIPITGEEYDRLVAAYRK